MNKQKVKLKIKHALWALILLFTSVAATFFCIELFCRLYVQSHKGDNFIQSHEKLGRFFIPGKKGWYVSKQFVQYIEINSKGLRDKEHSYTKPKDTFRIMLLADSFGAAFQVRLEETFHSILEKELNSGRENIHFEGINGSYPGWGTGKELEFYQCEGYKYSPDLVLLAFLTSNDVMDNYYWSKNRQTIQTKTENKVIKEPMISYMEKIKEWLTANVRLYSYINKRLKENTNPKLLFILEQLGLLGDRRPFSKDYIPADYFVYASEETPEIKKGWQETKGFIRSLEAVVEENGSQLAVVILTDREQVHRDIWEETKQTYPKMKESEWNTSRPRQILIEFLRKNNIAFLDLLPYFEDFNKKTGKYLHFRYDGHWNAEGHRLAGETISAWLLSQKMITKEGE